MSETEQKEVEFVTGTISGINQRAADRWQVAVTPAGSQYSKNLWTKEADLVGALSSRIGESETFRCGVSHWTNNEGKAVRSLWIDAVGGSLAAEGAASAVATPSVQSTSEAMSKEDWADKDRRDYRSRSWAHTISLLGDNIALPETVSSADITRLHSELKLMVELIYVDICRSHEFAHPNVGEGVEFGTPERDDIPFS